MDTRIDEVADGIYRLSSFDPHVAGVGMTFNQFLVLGEEPLLFHTGRRRMFPSVRAALSRVMSPDRLRWITFGHYESDECGAMNEWLAVAPNAEVAHGQTACLVSLGDMADRAPRILADGAVIELGLGKACAISTRRTSPMGGKLECCMKKPHAPCSAVTCSRSWASLLS
jgi:flavorubredoxin